MTEILPAWSRPPFESGNEAALQHGAYSPRRVDPLAAELVANIREALPYLAERRWAPALWAWGRAEAQVQILSEWLADRGSENGDGVGDLGDARVLAAYGLLHKAESRADRSRARLGMDPLSAARLGRDLTAATFDVARVMGELARVEGESVDVDEEPS